MTRHVARPPRGGNGVSPEYIEEYRNKGLAGVVAFFILGLTLGCLAGRWMADSAPTSVYRPERFLAEGGMMYYFDLTIAAVAGVTATVTVAGVLIFWSWVFPYQDVSESYDSDDAVDAA